jgi:inositol-1,4,5-trisphosphate 5-phosphatase
VSVEGREVLSGNIENVPIKDKAKFPQHFFPEVRIRSTDNHNNSWL